MQNLKIGNQQCQHRHPNTICYESVISVVGMIDHNVTLIARALGGEAPRDGFNGQLAMAR